MENLAFLDSGRVWMLHNLLAYANDETVPLSTIFRGGPGETLSGNQSMFREANSPEVCEVLGAILLVSLVLLSL